MPTLTATATGLTSATQQETVFAAAAAQFAFTTSAQTLTAGVTSGVLTVQLQDAFGNAASAGSGGQAISLSTSSNVGFFRDTADSTTITSVTIAAGSSTASFKYNDTQAGS